MPGYPEIGPVIICCLFRVGPGCCARCRDCLDPHTAPTAPLLRDETSRRGLTGFLRRRRVRRRRLDRPHRLGVSQGLRDRLGWPVDRWRWLVRLRFRASAASFFADPRPLAPDGVARGLRYGFRWPVDRAQGVRRRSGLLAHGQRCPSAGSHPFQVHNFAHVATLFAHFVPPRPFWSRGLRSGLSVLVFLGGFWCCCPPGFFLASAGVVGLGHRMGLLVSPEETSRRLKGFHPRCLLSPDRAPRALIGVSAKFQ